MDNNQNNEDFKQESKRSMLKKFEQIKEEATALGDWGTFKSGEWFMKIIHKSFSNYYKSANVEYFYAKYNTDNKDFIANKLIGVAAKNSAILGGIVGATISTDELVAIFTAGEGGVGLPANIAIACVAIMGETVGLTQIQLQLVANLAKLYDVPLDVDDPEDILTIFAFAIGGVISEGSGKAFMKAGGKATASFVKKTIRKEILANIKKLAEKIGIKILQRTIIKYAVPVVSIGIGATWNFASTKTVGKVAIKHFHDKKEEVDKGMWE